MNKFLWLFVLLPALTTALTGCGHDQQAAPPLSVPASPTFTTALPAPLAGMELKEGGRCPLDRVNKQDQTATSTRVSRNEPLLLDGWALDLQTANVPPIVVAELATESGYGPFYAVAKRVRRPDVAQGFMNPAYEGSGFTLASSIAAVPAGRYHVNILQTRDKRLIRCRSEKDIEVY